MKKVFLLPLACLVASCAASSSLSDQPVILSNGSKISLYYKTVGLNDARSVPPEKRIPLGSNGIQEIKPGNQALLKPARSYANNGGIAVLVYQVRTIGDLTELVLAGLREVTMQQLESGIPVVLE